MSTDSWWHWWFYKDINGYSDIPADIRTDEARTVRAGFLEGMRSSFRKIRLPRFGLPLPLKFSIFEIPTPTLRKYNTIICNFFFSFSVWQSSVESFFHLKVAPFFLHRKWRNSLNTCADFQAPFVYWLRSFWAKTGHLNENKNVHVTFAIKKACRMRDFFLIPRITVAFIVTKEYIRS